MIEQSIEARVLAKIKDSLSALGIDNVRLVGQLEAVEGVKGLEDADDQIIIIAKSSPRSYATPTIPTCTITVDVNALVRADIDYNGANYLAVTDRLMQIFQNWQRCYDDTHEDFSIDGEFDCTGFQLDTGSFSLDATGKLWQYNHGMTIYGVVNDLTNT